MRWPSLLLLTLACLPLPGLQAASLEMLQPVGEARLRVMFFTIYDSRLYSPDGDYQGIEPNLALQITYRRNIDSSDLVNRTRKEWRQLSLYNRQSEHWLETLACIWPDIRKGDTLTVRVDEGLASQFFFNGEMLGSISSPDFTRNFLAIWLSERSSYPQLRDQLVGQD